MPLRINRTLCVMHYMFIVTNPQCMRSKIIVDAGHRCLLLLAGELSTDEADDSGFLSTQRVCIVG